jgi:hypothetical protein
VVVTFLEYTPVMTSVVSMLQEHDLIHGLYFKRLPLLRNLVFTGIWLIKANVSPW